MIINAEGARPACRKKVSTTAYQFFLSIFNLTGLAFENTLQYIDTNIHFYEADFPNGNYLI